MKQLDINQSKFSKFKNAREKTAISSIAINEFINEIRSESKDTHNINDIRKLTAIISEKKQLIFDIEQKLQERKIVLDIETDSATKKIIQNDVDDILKNIITLNTELDILTDKKSKLKSTLTCYTVAAEFKSTRKTDDEKKLSGYLCLDFDHIENLDKIKQQLLDVPYTFIVAKSVSGDGLFVIVKIENVYDANDFKDCYKQLEKEYCNIAATDQQCCNIGRLRYTSHDENIVVVESALPFRYDKKISEKEASHTALSYIDDFGMGWWNDFMSSGNAAGILANRHDWLRFAMSMKECGLSFEDFNTISMMSPNYISREDCEKMWNREVPKNVTKGTLIYFVEHVANFKLKRPKKKSKNTESGRVDNVNEVESDKKESKGVTTLRFMSEHYDFRDNVCTQRYEYKLKTETEFHELTDTKVSYISSQVSLTYNVDNSDENILQKVRVLSDNNQYNPILDYYNSIPEFSERNVIKEVIDCMNVENPDSAYNYLKTWLIASCKQIEQEINGKGNEICLILKGSQGCGKNRFVDYLAKPFGLFHCKIDGKISDKDTYARLAKNVIVHMDELNCMQKASGVEEIKSFISTDVLTYRRPYGRTDEKYKRYANFIGSTNEQGFLMDSTGQRRFPVLEIKKDKKIEIEKMPSVSEVWGYAKHLLAQGELSYLTDEMIATITSESDKYSIETIESSVLESMCCTDDGVKITIMTAKLYEYINSAKNIKISIKSLSKSYKKITGNDVRVMREGGKCVKVYDLTISSDDCIAIKKFFADKGESSAFLIEEEIKQKKQVQHVEEPLPF